MKSLSDRAAGRMNRPTAELEAEPWQVEDLRTERPQAAAQADRDADLEAAFERGRAEGLAIGVEEGRRLEAERVADAVRALTAAAAELRANSDAWLRTIEENISALAVAVARHVIGREIRSDGAAVADLVRRALTEFPVDEPVKVRLHPEDLSVISTVSTSDGQPVPVAPGRDLRWIADPEVEPGGCVVEGRKRIVDGRIDRALERVYRSLTDD